MGKRRASPEAAIQRAVFEHIRWRGAPGLVAFHPANGGFRRPIEAAILKSQGVLAGVADIIALHRGIFYAVEIKSEGGRPTEAQLAFLNAVNAAGGFACCCEGLDRALATLEAWGLLRPNGAIHVDEQRFVQPSQSDRQNGKTRIRI